MPAKIHFKGDFPARPSDLGTNLARRSAPLAQNWCGGRRALAAKTTLRCLTLWAAGLFTTPALTVHAGELAVTVTDPEGHGLADVAVIAEPAKPDHAAHPERHAIMDQHDLRFVPEVLVVQTGTYVDFPNTDQVLHQVYSFSRAKTFQLSLYAGRAHPPVQFDRAGIVTLGCNIHDSMIGYIYVTDSPFFGQTDAAGRLEMHGMPAGDYTIVAWHPRAAEAEGLRQTLTLSAEQDATVALHFSKPLRPGMEHGKQWADY
jgi:plastocyanin